MILNTGCVRRGRKDLRMIGVEVVVLKVLMDFCGDEKQGSMSQLQLVSDQREKLTGRIDACWMRVSFFLKATVQNKAANIFDHLPVLKVKKTDFSQEEAHVQKYQPGEDAEYSGDAFVSEDFHAGQNYAKFF